MSSASLAKPVEICSTAKQHEDDDGRDETGEDADEAHRRDDDDRRHLRRGRGP